MAMALGSIAIDGDVFDVLEDCDAVSLGLGRLRRQGRISEQDWRTAVEHLGAIQARIEAYLMPQYVAAPPRQQGEVG